MEIPGLRIGPNLTQSAGFDALAKQANDLEKSRPSFSEELSRTPTQGEGEPLRKAFQDFVGQTLFSQMIASMRKTQSDVPYFNGGQAEKIFQGQLDQVLSQELSNASASKISDPMFKLFQLRRQ
jgi:Rod binding domain-containing protein